MSKAKISQYQKPYVESYRLCLFAHMGLFLLAKEIDMFTPGKRFKKDYDKLFKEDPVSANLMLLLCDIADENGKFIIAEPVEDEICRLMSARFNDVSAYQLERC